MNIKLQNFLFCTLFFICNLKGSQQNSRKRNLDNNKYEHPTVLTKRNGSETFVNEKFNLEVQIKKIVCNEFNFINILSNFIEYDKIFSSKLVEYKEYLDNLKKDVDYVIKNSNLCNNDTFAIKKQDLCSIMQNFKEHFIDEHAALLLNYKSLMSLTDINSIFATKEVINAQNDFKEDFASFENELFLHNNIDDIHEKIKSKTPSINEVSTEFKIIITNKKFYLLSNL